MANMMTCDEPRAAYHIGPEMPKMYAKVELVSNVADHVQADTMPATMRPGLTFRDAVLNSSDCLVEKAK